MVKQELDIYTNPENNQEAKDTAMTKFETLNKGIQAIRSLLEETSVAYDAADQIYKQMTAGLSFNVSITILVLTQVIVQDDPHLP